MHPEVLVTHQLDANHAVLRAKRSNETVAETSVVATIIVAHASHSRSHAQTVVKKTLCRSSQEATDQFFAETVSNNSVKQHKL